MRGLRFTLKRVTVIPMTDLAYLDADQEPDSEALAQGVMDALGVTIEVTVSDVTMHLAAWRDPDHWADDWREALDFRVEHEEVAEAVAELLAAGLEE